MTIWTAQPLNGRSVSLLPLERSHIAPLWEVAQDPELWRYMPFAADSFEAFEAYLQQVLTERDRGHCLPFVTQERASGRCIGATSFLAISAAHRRLEIGGTWITPAFQRSAVNTEAKLLQLTDAFERLGCLRVELKTDALNARSRRAIARIGGQEEGTFRNHMVMPDGRIRDTVWFSITDREWPAVKTRLVARLAKGS